MKKYCLFLITTIFLAGCGSMSSSKGEKHQMELSLHKVRTEVEDIKHELNTYEIEHHVIEGKLIDQEQTIASLRQQMAELKSGKLDSFVQESQNLEKKLQQVSKKQEKIVIDIRQLSSHANDTTTALSQYKDKIAQFEKAIQEQNVQLKEIPKIKKGITKLAEVESFKTYKVQAGDSLEKIARDNHTTVEELKRLNQMRTDLIVIDQLINLP
ncbi:MAG: LysM peptidoglycan-binding domain-containing protein [Candidatus Neptunochlamydia sp.]|nr:LysM peptidoglycan-binding domain-containing protein [Candidatus Neptunochlamydia sp.]